MEQITKIEKCSSCDGDGYTYSHLYTDEYGDEAGYCYFPCKNCGGDGNHNTLLSSIKKGTGQVKLTYKEIVCTECNGEKKARYMKSGYGSQHTLFGDVSYEEQKAWENKFTELKTCQNCKGSGNELKYVSSEAAEKGCFITTSCVTYYNMEDDCYELELLRKFRDTYVKSLSNGKLYLDEYYEKSPKIVRHIENQSNKDDIYKYIHKCINEAILHIENRQYKDAFDDYKHMYLRLLNMLK